MSGAGVVNRDKSNFLVTVKVLNSYEKHRIVRNERYEI